MGATRHVLNIKYLTPFSSGLSEKEDAFAVVIFTYLVHYFAIRSIGIDVLGSYSSTFNGTYDLNKCIYAFN